MLEIIRGSHDKPVVSEQIYQILESLKIDGIFYLGYPILPGFEASYEIDAMLVSPEYGVLVFDLFENQESEDRLEEHDDIINSLTSKFLQNKKLIKRRILKVNVNIITFAPRWNDFSNFSKEEFDFDFVKTTEELKSYLETIKWENKEYYQDLLQSIQAITNIKATPKRTKVTKVDSKGALLKHLENSIANLDNSQNKAVIETVEGVQRIRGLAGSGKTIILALKVAYLHVLNPNWKIAVTFNTRSLKDQFIELINRFVYEHKLESPDWTKIKVIHAWGSIKSEGVYHNICMMNGLEYYDFSSAKSSASDGDDIFGWICQKAYNKIKKNNLNFSEMYDLILIDEAQDFSEYFLKLCYEILTPEKRLVYAYDELQSLNKNLLSSPEEIFGKKSTGEPMVELKNEENRPKEDIILDVCYRNPRPILISAHALGFGIYNKTEWIQLFDEHSLWKDIGYSVVEGNLTDGCHVVLERKDKNSPLFLEQHSTLEDLIQFKSFEDRNKQAEYIALEIQKNLEDDELEYRDIIVIHSDPYKTRSEVIPLRMELEKLGIKSHLTGLNTSPDNFFADDSITFTSIYRAKGNEAAMVYFIDAHYCYGGMELARKRNILFTAMTRSKAWLRVTGYGEKMISLIEEYEKIKSYDFKLDFTYPTEAERTRINLIHRDKTKNEKNEIKGTVNSLNTTLDLLKKGKIYKEDLPPELVAQIKEMFNND